MAVLLRDGVDNDGQPLRQPLEVLVPAGKDAHVDEHVSERLALRRR
jgi:hypothetical protein